MRISTKPRPRRKKHRIASLLFFILIILALIIWLDYTIRPSIENIVEYQAKVFAAKLINETMIEEMERLDVRYDEIVHITRNKSGGIASIEADIIQINRLKSNMGKSIVSKLENERDHEIFIPAGTIAGTQFTSGRGPKVGVKIIPTGYVQSEIYNKFTSAGINQTQHQIMLRVTVQMLAVLPGYSVKTETETNFPIAETVIIGEIPQGYASIGDSKAVFLPIEK